MKKYNIFILDTFNFVLYHENTVNELTDDLKLIGKAVLKKTNKQKISKLKKEIKKGKNICTSDGRIMEIVEISLIK